MTEPAAWSGVHHLTINVQDVAASERWYSDVLGFDRLTEWETENFRRVLLRHPASGMVLGLNRHTSPEAAEPFDERRAGLDHLALHVADRAALEAWVARFDALGVTHSGIQPAGTPGSALVVFRDPDGIQLEVFAPPA